MRDLVIAGVDGVQRTHPGGNMAVHVEPELLRLGDGGRQPFRVERAVELDADEPVPRGPADQRDGLSLARGDIGHLRGVGSLAVDERRRVDVGKEQVAAGPACARSIVADRCCPDPSPKSRRVRAPAGR